MNKIDISEILPEEFIALDEYAFHVGELIAYTNEKRTNLRVNPHNKQPFSKEAWKEIESDDRLSNCVRKNKQKELIQVHLARIEAVRGSFRDISQLVSDPEIDNGHNNNNNNNSAQQPQFQIGYTLFAIDEETDINEDSNTTTSTTTTTTSSSTTNTGPFSTPGCGKNT